MKRRPEDENSQSSKLGSGATPPAEPSSQASHWAQVLGKCQDKAFLERLELVYHTEEISPVVRKGLGDILEKLTFPSPNSPDYESACQRIVDGILSLMANQPMSFGGTKEIDILKATPDLVERLRSCLDQERTLLQSANNTVDVLNLKTTELQKNLRSALDQCQHFLNVLEDKGRVLIEETWPTVKASLVHAGPSEQANILDHPVLQQALQNAIQALAKAMDHYLNIWNPVEAEIVRYRNFQKLRSVMLHMSTTTAEQTEPEGALAALNAICFELAPFAHNILEIITKWIDALNGPHIPMPLMSILNERRNTMTACIQHFLTRCFFIKRNPYHTMRIIKTKKDKNAPKKSDKSLEISVWMFGGACYIPDKKTHVRMTLAEESGVNDNLECETSAAGDLHPSIFQLKQASKLNVSNYAGDAKFDIGNFNRPVNDKNGTNTTYSTYVVILEAQISFFGRHFLVKSASLPIIFVSTGGQQWHSLGKHMWNARFSEQSINRYVANSKASVPWCQISALLQDYCLAKTGKELTKEHLDYLARRMFEKPDGTDFSQLKVSQEQFLKGPLKDSKGKVAKDLESLWRWFYVCINLVANTVNTAWKKGWIYGFISRRSAEALLQNCQPNTCLLRFSERKAEESNGINREAHLVIAAVVISEGGKKHVLHAPLDKRKQSLVQILDKPSIRTSDGYRYQLHYIYPAISIAEVLNELSEEKPEKREEPDRYYSCILENGITDAIETPINSPWSSISTQSQTDSLSEIGTVDCPPMGQFTEQSLGNASLIAGLGTLDNKVMSPSLVSMMPSPQHVNDVPSFQASGSIMAQQSQTDSLSETVTMEFPPMGHFTEQQPNSCNASLLAGLGTPYNNVMAPSLASVMPSPQLSETRTHFMEQLLINSSASLPTVLETLGDNVTASSLGSTLGSLHHAPTCTPMTSQPSTQPISQEHQYPVSHPNGTTSQQVFSPEQQLEQQLYNSSMHMYPLDSGLPPNPSIPWQSELELQDNLSNMQLNTLSSDDALPDDLRNIPHTSLLSWLESASPTN